MSKLLSKKIAFLSIILLLVLSSTGFTYKSLIPSIPVACDTAKGCIVKPSMYETLNLSVIGLSKQAFDYAMLGLEKLNESGKIKNNKIISIIDFSLPSSVKRLFVIDMEH